LLVRKVNVCSVRHHFLNANIWRMDNEDEEEERGIGDDDETDVYVVVAGW
jgi:hypothetical protein